MTRPLHLATGRALAQSGASRSLPNARAEVDRLNEQLATGLRINRASDDPAAFSQSRSLRALEERLAHHQRSIASAQSWTDESAGALTAVADLFSQAREIGLRGSNGILDREDFARQIESLRDEAIERLNARSVDGEYLFAGNQTRTRPLNDDGTLAPGDFSARRVREIAPGLSLPINVPGTDALAVGGTPLPEIFQALADAIRSGDPAATATALAGAEDAEGHVIRLEAGLGDTRRRLDVAATAVDAQNLAAASRRSDLEDADLAEVLGELQRRQTALEAALRVTASSSQMSLMDYLR